LLADLRNEEIWPMHTLDKLVAQFFGIKRRKS